MWRRSYDHKLVNENFHKFLASIARVYPPTDHNTKCKRKLVIALSISSHSSSVHPPPVDPISHDGLPSVNSHEFKVAPAVTARRSTASDLSRQLSSATGTTVSRQTVYRCLGHIGLYARRPVRCVPLTATHCRLRLTGSREHALWTPKQWSCVMFSDESRFSLLSDYCWTLIRSAPGTSYQQENTIERHRYGGAGWLARIWGGIILGSRTDLHVQSVTMTDHIYRGVILEQHVCLFRGAMGAKFLFMDYNIHPHCESIVDECLQSEDITHMDWPAYSPDFNPIEHVWDMPGRRITANQPPPTCTGTTEGIA
ncbi:transposable element Tcb1 transposase [Trichonephila clavipes]|nr:transposable element Tcb1 transposase [Trichonephila clavipes]